MYQLRTHWTQSLFKSSLKWGIWSISWYCVLSCVSFQDAIRYFLQFAVINTALDDERVSVGSLGTIAYSENDFIWSMVIILRISWHDKSTCVCPNSALSFQHFTLRLLIARLHWSPCLYQRRISRRCSRQKNRTSPGSNWSRGIDFSHFLQYLTDRSHLACLMSILVSALLHLVCISLEFMYNLYTRETRLDTPHNVFLFSLTIYPRIAKNILFNIQTLSEIVWIANKWIFIVFICAFEVASDFFKDQFIFHDAMGLSRVNSFDSRDIPSEGDVGFYELMTFKVSPQFEMFI